MPENGGQPTRAQLADEAAQAAMMLCAHCCRVIRAEVEAGRGQLIDWLNAALFVYADAMAQQAEARAAEGEEPEVWTPRRILQLRLEAEEAHPLEWREVWPQIQLLMAEQDALEQAVLAGLAADAEAEAGLGQVVRIPVRHTSEDRATVHMHEPQLQEVHDEQHDEPEPPAAA